MSYLDEKIKEISDKINTAKKTCIDNLNNETNNTKKISIINEYYTSILEIYNTYSYLTTCRIRRQYYDCELEKKKYYEQLLNIFSYNNLMEYTQKSTAPLVPNYNINIGTYIYINDDKFTKLIKDCQEKIQKKIENHNSKSKSGGKKIITKKTTTKKDTKKPKK